MRPMNEMPELHVDFELVAKYLAGEATPEEVRAVESWAAEAESNRKELENLRLMMEVEPETEGFDTDAAWSRVSSQTVATPTTAPASRRWLMPVAAAAILLIAVTFFFFRNPGEVAPKMLSFKTEDKTEVLTLPDGSSITLNAHSELTYPEKFADNGRNVSLKGEAFFQVAHNPEAPFSISAEGSKITVLGTEFNVRTGSQEVEVLVESGKVQFEQEKETSKESEKVILTKGEKGIFNREKGTVSEEQSEDQNEMFWRTGSLKYTDAPLSQVFAELESIFQVEIELENSAIGQCALGGSYTDVTLESVLTAISKSFDLKFEQNESRYIISGEGCQ